MSTPPNVDVPRDQTSLLQEARVIIERLEGMNHTLRIQRPQVFVVGIIFGCVIMPMMSFVSFMFKAVEDHMEPTYADAPASDVPSESVPATTPDDDSPIHPLPSPRLTITTDDGRDALLLFVEGERNCIVVQTTQPTASPDVRGQYICWSEPRRAPPAWCELAPAGLPQMIGRRAILKREEPTFDDEGRHRPEHP